MKNSRLCRLFSLFAVGIFSASLIHAADFPSYNFETGCHNWAAQSKQDITLDECMDGNRKKRAETEKLWPKLTSDQQSECIEEVANAPSEAKYAKLELCIIKKSLTTLAPVPNLDSTDRQKNQ